MNINHTRDLVRLANAYYDTTGISPEERADDMNHVALCTWSFVRCMKRHLSPVEEDEDDFRAELYNKLPPKQAEMIIGAAHRPNRALQDLSYAIDDLPMHFIRKNEIQRAVTIFEDNLGSSERLLTSPVPVFYSRHLARMLFVWLAVLPFALYDPFATSWNHVGMIPATAVLSVFLFGIEELGTQLEEPFTILPMQVFCDKIYNWCLEIASWSPGDNGRAMKAIRPEHAYFASVPVPETATYYTQAYAEPEPAYQGYQNGAPPNGAAKVPAPVQGGQMTMAEFLYNQRSIS
jgi:ion channel-forming bestrophin family protein